VTGSVQVN